MGSPESRPSINPYQPRIEDPELKSVYMSLSEQVRGYVGTTLFIQQHPELSQQERGRIQKENQGRLMAILRDDKLSTELSQYSNSAYQAEGRKPR